MNNFIRFKHNYFNFILSHYFIEKVNFLRYIIIYFQPINRYVAYIFYISI